MKKLTLLLITLLMAGTSIAQEYEPKWIELTDAERTLVQKNNDFAFRLFQKSRTDIRAFFQGFLYFGESCFFSCIFGKVRV